MNNEDIIILLTDVFLQHRFDDYRDQAIAKGILVNSIRRIDFSLDQWEAFLFTENKERILCSQVTAPFGSGFFQINTEECTIDSRNDNENQGLDFVVRGAASNQLDLWLHTKRFQALCPVFLCTSPDYHPDIIQVNVELIFSTLAETPDLIAEIDFRRDLESSWVTPETPFLARPSGEFEMAASKLKPQCGFFFPIQFTKNNTSNMGVLRLDERIEDGMFHATLYLTNSDAGIARGTLLTRDLAWGSSYNRRQTSTIARIIEIY